MVFVCLIVESINVKRVSHILNPFGIFDSVYHFFDAWQEDYYIVFGHPSRQKELG